MTSSVEHYRINLQGKALVTASIEGEDASERRREVRSRITELGCISVTASVFMMDSEYIDIISLLTSSCGPLLTKDDNILVVHSDQNGLQGTLIVAARDGAGIRVK